jgi:hypothetical protein
MEPTQTTTNTPKAATKQPISSAPETANDKSGLPAELSVQQNPLDIKEILLKAPETVLVFTYGDFIPGAVAFNQYLEANVQPGKQMQMTKVRVVQLIKHLAFTMNSGGLASLPMLCLDDECPRAADCPIRLIGEPAPIGEQCPIEKAEGLNHVRGLSKDFGTGRSYADQVMIQAVSAIQMLKTRVFADLASHPDPIMEVEKGIDARGNVVRDKVENPNFKILQNLTKQEQILLKGLHLTQEQRIKMEASSIKTTDMLIGDLREKLQKIQRDNKSEGLDIIDADIIVKDEINEEIHSGDGSNESGTHQKQTPGDTPIDTNRVSPDKNGAAGDIGQRLESMDGPKKDYRSTEPGSTEPSNKSYLGQSPFSGRGSGGQNSDSGSNANSMEEAG